MHTIFNVTALTPTDLAALTERNRGGEGLEKLLPFSPHPSESRAQLVSILLGDLEVSVRYVPNYSTELWFLKDGKGVSVPEITGGDEVTTIEDSELFDVLMKAAEHPLNLGDRGIPRRVAPLHTSKPN
jgi:hypothetical protein